MVIGYLKKDHPMIRFNLLKIICVNLVDQSKKAKRNFRFRCEDTAFKRIELSIIY